MHHLYSISVCWWNEWVNKWNINSLVFHPCLLWYGQAPTILLYLIFYWGQSKELLPIFWPLTFADKPTMPSSSLCISWNLTPSYGSFPKISCSLKHFLISLKHMWSLIPFFQFPKLWIFTFLTAWILMPYNSLFARFIPFIRL